MSHEISMALARGLALASIAPDILTAGGIRVLSFYPLAPTSPIISKRFNLGFL